MNGPPAPYGDTRSNVPQHLRRNRVIVRVELAICDDNGGWYDPVVLKDTHQAVPNDLDLDRLMAAVDSAVSTATRSPWPVRLARFFRRGRRR